MVAESGRRLTIKQILAWADTHRKRTGRWPNPRCDPVRGAPSETWAAINEALRKGYRGLRNRDTLAGVLARHRGVSRGRDSVRLTIKQMLAWADAHHRRTGQWPILRDGPVPGVPAAPGQDWRNIDNALRLGFGGLPGGSSLAKFLHKHRGVRNKKGCPPLTSEAILAWADAHHRRTGRWPTTASGAVARSDGETWSGIGGALSQGTRGLPGNDSLARFLGKHRGVRNRKDAPPMSVRKIVTWAREHHRRTGRWPTAKAGPVAAAPGETWAAIAHAIIRGTRGLKGRTTLARLLDKHC